MVNFEAGKWYGHHPTWKDFYIKVDSFDGLNIHSTEQIHQGGLYTTVKQKYMTALEGYKEVAIEEIARFIPEQTYHLW
jgi:hypothetical protein